MLAVIIVGSPNSGSLLHSMASAAERVLRARAYEVASHDLYAESFQPVQPTGELQNTTSTDPLVEQHCTELAAADLLLVFHPNWWGQPPAIVKGWIDRTFRLNVAYGYPPGIPPEGEPVGLLKARCAVIINTSNTPPAREASVFGDPLDGLWRKCVLGLCGIGCVERRMYGPVSGSTEEVRRCWLAEVEALVERVA